MKKSSNDIVRSLFLMAAMIIIGAGSAFAQTESDYFSLTKNVGTVSERTSYYTTFAGAVGDAKDGDKITLLKDYTATAPVYIGDGETTTKMKLDLNDHTISFNFDDNLITVKSGAMLTVINTDTYTDKKGTLTAGDDYGRSPINVNTGGTLHVTGVSINGRDRPGIYIDGTAEIDDCDLGGDCGFESNGTTYVTKSNLSGRNYGIWVVGGTTTIGEDVYIPYFACYGICYNDGAIILNALPTFGKSRDPEIYDIAIACGLSLTFGQVSIKKPDQKISLSINGTGVDPATYTKAIATNYEAAFTDNGIMIDPNDVFRWYYDNNPDGFRTDATGAMVFGAVKASVSTYNAGSAPTIENYTTLADALAAAQAGYIAGNGGDVEEFIPTVTLLADIDAKETWFSIGDGSTTTKVKLDLNDKTIMRPQLDNKLFFVSTGATLELINTDSDPNPEKTGTITREEDWGGSAIAVASGGELIATGVTIEGGSTGIYIEGTAVIDDCKIRGKYAIRDYGTVTVTNSDIIGGDGSSIQVGEKVYVDGDGNQFKIYDGCLTIGEEVYISGGYPAIDYYAGTVILKALPTFGTERPKTSSTTRAKTRDYFYYDIGIKSGLSFIFEEGTFKTPDKDKTISIYITDNDGPVDPVTYTNAFTVGYSDYVKDGGEVIDPNKVFRWAEEFTHGFRMDAAGEVIFNHAAVTVTSYSGTSTPTTTPYYDFSKAIAAANSGYKTASEAGGTEFIPTLKMLDDVSIDTGVEIGDGSTVTKVTLDLNDHELKGNCDAGTIIVKGKATLNLVDTGTDNSKGMVWNSKNETGTNCIYVWDDGELTATGVSIKSDMGTALLNNGSTTVGEGVSFSGNREASIYNHQGTLTLTAWPTFGGSETEGYADIKLYNGRAVTFGGTGLGAPTQKVTLRVVDSSDSDVDAATYTYAITDGYGAKVTDANGSIDPNDVFEWYKKSDGVGFYFNGTESTITVRYKITYNLNGGAFVTGETNPTTYTAETDDITLYSPVKDGSVFQGWYDNENFTGDAITTIAKGSTGDKTLYARWKIITAISVQNTSLDLKVNDEVAMGATLSPAAAGTLTYTSSNSSVATVDNGTIKAIAPGTATITVSYAGNTQYTAAESKTISVTVSLNDASVSVSDGENEITSLNLYVDDTYPIVPTTTPEGLDVTYTADGSGVVSVDDNGVVTALKAGSGSITVKVGGDGVYAEDSTVVGITVIPTYAMEDLFSGSNEWTDYVAEEDLALPDGLSAYIITALGTGTATAVAIDYIPKGEPVLLRRTDKNKNSYTALPYAGTGTAPAGNLLRAATATSQPAAYRDYLLYRDAFVLSAEGTLATGKVYLPAPQASQSRTATRSIIIDGDGTTSMDGRPWATDQEDGAWHDMQGRKYDNRPTKKGLYIHNGKKEVVR